MSAKKFFTKEQQLVIQKAIADAERATSGEVRVHIDDECKGDVLDVATDVFHKLKMNKTELRNGVLFYLAVSNRQFAILGDKGINQKVPENFWDNIKEHMQAQFKKGKFTEGLCEGLEKAGEQLKKHFPHKRYDVNELKDEVSFG